MIMGIASITAIITAIASIAAGITGKISANHKAEAARNNGFADESTLDNVSATSESLASLMSMFGSLSNRPRTRTTPNINSDNAR